MSFGRLERREREQPLSDINVTPLVDVMLVLLVIFMLTAPLLTTTLRLDLPQAQAGAAAATVASLRLEIEASGQLHLDGQPVEAAALAQRLAQVAATRPDTEVQLRADQAVPYGRVAEVLDLAQKAGLLRIGFVAQPAARTQP